MADAVFGCSTSAGYRRSEDCSFHKTAATGDGRKAPGWEDATLALASAVPMEAGRQELYLTGAKASLQFMIPHTVRKE